MGDDMIAIEITWKTTLQLLLGTILAFNDPITDMLTLKEFYRTGHNVWFGVGLCFVILPTTVTSMLYCWHFKIDRMSAVGKLIINGICNPFSVAVARLRGFLLCLLNFKTLWSGEELDANSQKEIEEVMYYAQWSGIFEAVLESAPQFLIQLYAMNVQEEEISVIQIFSVISSFLGLAYTFIAADQWRLSTVLSSSNRARVEINIDMKVKAVLFVSQLFHLIGRLLAITYFTVSFKWWVILIVLVHSFSMASARFWVDLCTCSGTGALCANCLTVPIAMLFYWIRDDGAAGKTVQEKDKTLTKILLISNILFVLENVFMISLYYFTADSPRPWYSKPVTICVCLCSVLAAVTRVKYYRYIFSKSGEDTGNSDTAGQQPKEDEGLPPPQENLKI